MFYKVNMTNRIILENKKSRLGQQADTKGFYHMLGEDHPDLILVSGGDGALLHAIQEYNDLQVPFFWLRYLYIKFFKVLN